MLFLSFFYVASFFTDQHVLPATHAACCLSPHAPPCSQANICEVQDQLEADSRQRAVLEEELTAARANKDSLEQLTAEASGPAE